MSTVGTFSMLIGFGILPLLPRLRLCRHPIFGHVLLCLPQLLYISVHYSIIDCVHKHKIKISEVKKLGLERTRKRWGLGWTVARKRAIQLFTALAETRLVVRQRSMLVAFCSIPSDNHSTGSGCYTACLHNGSQRTRNGHVRKSNEVARGNIRANQKTASRA